MPPLQADENVPRRLVDLLRGAGADVATAADSGLRRTPDPDLLSAASAAGRAVLTHDRDYIRLHKNGATHAGIVFLSEDHDLDALALRVIAALAGAGDLAGQLVRVNRPPQVP